MAAVRYFDLVREMRDAYNHRLRLVQFARQYGIKPAARAFATTVTPQVREFIKVKGPEKMQNNHKGPPFFLGINEDTLTSWTPFANGK